MVRSTRFVLVLATLTLCLASTAQARKKKRKAKTPDDGLPSVEDVMVKARDVYGDLKGNSNPVVRRMVFDGLLALDKEDRKAAIDMGLKESDEGIKLDAMGLVLKGKDRAARTKVIGMIQKMLESGEEAQREQGYALVKNNFKSKAALKAIKQAAKDGVPDARTAARGWLLKQGGKTAWKVVEAGLKEGDGTPERTQALKFLETYKGSLGVKWALAQMHDPAMGEVARAYLTRVDDKRASKLLDKKLSKAYQKKGADFDARLRIASVLARRGQTEQVKKTLKFGLSSRYKKPAMRLVAWKGLENVRDVTILAAVRGLIKANEKEAEADLAYAWMHAWAKTNAEPQVIKLLQEVARSDRRQLRLRAMKILTDIKHRPSKTVFEEAIAEGQNEMKIAGAKGLAAIAKTGDEKDIAKKLRREQNVEVKMALVEGLANIGTPAIIDSLQFVITAPQKELKLAAARAVAGTGSPKAATLMGLLKRAPDVDVRFVAWSSLLVLKPESLREFKAGALSWLTTDHVEALGKDPKISLDVIDFIATKGNDEQRMYAVSALEARGAKAATRLLGLVQNERNPDTAASSLNALAKLRKGESLSTYRKALKSDHGELRAAAFSAVGDWGHRALLETVLSGMGDKDPQARAAATAAAVKLAARES
jgi:HEAT repeat protein